MDFSPSDLRQTAYEWQNSTALPVLADPLSGSPAQSTDVELYTSRASPMLNNDISTNVDPKELDRSSSYRQAKRQTGHAVKDHIETPSPDNHYDLEPRKKRRQGEMSDTNHQDLTEQAEFRRRRNRLAASKCRRKSKQKHEIMLEREKELEQQCHILKSCVQSLKVEVLDLREELLEHALCDCRLIQNHLAKSVQAVMSQPDVAPWKISTP